MIRKYSNETISKAIEMHVEGYSSNFISRSVGCTYKTVARWINGHYYNKLKDYEIITLKSNV